MEQFKRDKNQKSAKLHLDKYYTPSGVARMCIAIAHNVIGVDNITEVIEPSAGSGSFSRLIPNCIAYDIEPDGDGIIQADFLSLDMDYKEGRLFIGNPPFGARNTLAVRFFKRCIQMGDFIAFILPISQVNNNQQMYEFDLVYSKDIGCIEFTDRRVHCCFNIYKRPTKGLNDKPSLKMDGVKITEIRLGNKDRGEYDIAICAWGSALGKRLDSDDAYAKELCIKFSPDIKISGVKLIENAKWKELYPMTSTPNLLQWQVIKYLKENIHG